MGKNNQQRRVAKRKARAAKSGSTSGQGSSSLGSAPGGPGQPTSQDVVADVPDRPAQARELIVTGVRAIGDPGALDNAVSELVVFDESAGQQNRMPAAEVATELLLQQIAVAYEHGWQPADLVHVARRTVGTGVAKLAAVLIIAQAAAERATARAPQDWLSQLESLTEGPILQTPGWNAVVQSGVRTSRWDGWHDVLALLGHWSDQRRLPRLVPPPSAWSHRRSAPAGPRPQQQGHDPKKLTMIRALLAKAEASEFVNEADAFTAKAQDLMTRYAIDEALLADAAHETEIRSRRVHIDNPYASTKVQLLAGVGRVNRVKVIWDDFSGIATAVGFPVDLDLAEMLFFSLQVQATRAMTESGAAARGGHRLDRAPAFRRAFLLSYADRIGERLSQAGEQARQQESEHRGHHLLPVLARRSAAVNTEFTRLFPRTRQSSTKLVDARGWQAGRAAADRAVLVKGQVAIHPDIR